MADLNDLPQRVRSYWKANRRLIASLLVIWAVVSYGCSILFVEQLNTIMIESLPLGFWFSQQGSIYVFVLLVLVYAVLMDRCDKKYGLGDSPAPPDETANEKSGEVNDG